MIGDTEKGSNRNLSCCCAIESLLTRHSDIIISLQRTIQLVPSTACPLGPRPEANGILVIWTLIMHPNSIKLNIGISIDFSSTKTNFSNWILIVPCVFSTCTLFCRVRMSYSRVDMMSCKLAVSSIWDLGGGAMWTLVVSKGVHVYDSPHL